MRNTLALFACLLIGSPVAHAQLEKDFLVWAEQVDGPTRAGGHAVVIDGDGYSYAAGYSADDTVSELQAVLTKFTPNGQRVWTRTIPGGFFEQMALDPDGNPVVAGEFASDKKYIYVNKYTPAGELLWERRFGATEYASTTGVSADPEGNVYLVGRYGSLMDVDPGTPVRNFTTEGRSGFICKLTPEGRYVWAHDMGRLSFSPVVFDETGDMYLSGSHVGVVDFDLTPGTLFITPTSTDGFAWKVTPEGETIWLKLFSGASHQSVAFHAVDSDRQMILGADFENRIQYGSTSLMGDGSRDIALIKLDEDGGLLWMKKIGGATYELSRSLQVDSLGYLYMSGFMDGKLDLYGGVLPEIEAPDAKQFVAKFDPDGNPLRGWAMHSGDTAQMVAVGPDNSFIACGTFGPSADFEPGPSESILISGEEDSLTTSMYLAKYEPMESTRPVVSRAVPKIDGVTNADQIAFEVSFDQPVTGFSSSADLRINHTGTSHAGVSIAGGPKTFTVTLSNITGDGNVFLQASTESDVETVWGVGVGEATGARIDIDNTAPAFGLKFVAGAARFDNLAVHPGEVVTMELSSSEELQSPFGVALLGAQAQVNETIATYAIPLDAPLGDVAIVVTGTDNAGNQAAQTFSGRLEIEELITPPTLAEIASTALVNLRANDTDQNGAYSAQEFRQALPDAASRFEELDYNDDGKIHPAELQRVVPVNKPFHTADLNLSGTLELSELIRIIQIYNVGSYRCAPPEDFTEDGYILAQATDWPESCVPHSSDYLSETGTLSLDEVLRAIQLYNFDQFQPCEGEDGFCSSSEQ